MNQKLISLMISKRLCRERTPSNLTHFQYYTKKSCMYECLISKGWFYLTSKFCWWYTAHSIWHATSSYDNKVSKVKSSKDWSQVQMQINSVPNKGEHFKLWASNMFICQASSLRFKDGEIIRIQHMWLSSRVSCRAIWNCIASIWIVESERS